MKKSKKTALAPVLIIFMVLGAFILQADDKELFMGLNVAENIVKPNVVILADTSGSMNNIIWYPKFGLDGEAGTADDGFDPTATYTGSVYKGCYYGSADFYTYEFEDNGTWWRSNGDETKWYGRWRDGTTARSYRWSDLHYYGNLTHFYEVSGSNVRVGSWGYSWSVGDWVLYININSTDKRYARAKIAAKYSDSSGNWLTLTDIEGAPMVGNSNWEQVWLERVPGKTPVVVRLYGETDTDHAARLDEDYLKWIFLYATDAQVAAVSHQAVYGTFDVTDTSLLGAWSICDKGNFKRPMKRFTRIQVTRDVLCHVARSSNTAVQLGLFTFNPGKEGDSGDGAAMVEGLGDMSDEVSLIDFLGKIWPIEGNCNTPVAEALSDIWYYMKPGPASKTRWPVDVELENGTISVSNAVSDIDWWCQNNYVVVMTDGESTQDNFNNSKYAGSIFKSKPVKRSASWTSWDDGWGDLDDNEAYFGRPSGYDADSSLYCPNWTCWISGSYGTDYLDDVAYFMRNQDMFPDKWFGDDPVTGWPGPQSIFTYVIGFNQDNDMLLETAINGDGAYYTANNYEELVAAFESVITSILLRNFAFSAITAPKKTTSISAEGVSYVGYFMPSQAVSIWEGHLLANKLIEEWGFDANDDGEYASDEKFSTREICEANNPGEICSRILSLSNTEDWDAAQQLEKRSADRLLYTHSGSTLMDFTAANKVTLQPMFGSGVNEEQAGAIISKISQKKFGDVFHSDIGFVGPPLMGKSFLVNHNPASCGDTPATDPDCYEKFATDNSSRTSVVYVGTNDGVLHKIKAVDGSEMWGFIPDEVLPTLKSIVLENEHNYTVDGRMLAEDIYFQSGDTNAWRTMLFFGLRAGGNAFYGLDITSATAAPTVKWKFKDADYSGESWSKPIVGQIRYKDGDDLVKRWVAVLAGGFAFNSENSSDTRGKAVFVVDASSGELLWMMGYNNTSGAEDDVATDFIDTASSDNLRYLTSTAEFNFAVPSGITAVDSDSDGLLDTIFFGNLGGHLFKTDISGTDRSKWRTYQMYRHAVTDLASGTIISMDGSVLNMGKDAANFTVGYSVTGQTSGAVGYVTEVDGAKKTVAVEVQQGAFQSGEIIKTRSYAPVYLAPAVAFDQCYQLWVTFGSGDRDRSRTNPVSGRYISILGKDTIDRELADLQQLSWSGTDNSELSKTTIDLENYSGWYFNFPDSKEKLFDPEPIIIPDTNGVPHLYFNTYTPPSETFSKEVLDNPCAAPQEGNMKLYNLSLSCAPSEVTGSREAGRIAGGGIYQGREFVQYLGTGAVGSVPPLDRVEDKRLPYPGGVIFIREKKR